MWVQTERPLERIVSTIDSHHDTQQMSFLFLWGLFRVSIFTITLLVGDEKMVY